MIRNVETTKYATKENANLVVPKMIIVNGVKNVTISHVFLLVKIMKLVQKINTAILMMKFAFQIVILTKIVEEGTNVQMVIVLNLAVKWISVQVMICIVTSKF